VDFQIWHAMRWEMESSGWEPTDLEKVKWGLAFTTRVTQDQVGKLCARSRMVYELQQQLTAGEEERKELMVELAGFRRMASLRVRKRGQSVGCLEAG
jgi:hypothetical protein